MDDIRDHFPIFCISELNVKKPFKNNNELFYRENTNDNIKRLNDFLALQNWQTVYNTYNVSESYNNFVEIFLHLYNHSCPIKHCKLKNNNNTWSTNGLRKACWTKNNLYVTSKTNPTMSNENKHKKYKNKLTNIMRN